VATNKLIIDVKEKGAKKAERNINKLSGSLSSLAGKVGGAAAAYFAGRGLINAIKGSIDAYGKQELAEKKLEAAIGKTSQSLLSYAKALQKQTMFGDEATLEAMAMLGAFTDNEQEIKELTKATLDLAAAKGFDLVAAADLVGKSFGSTTNALTRYGIEVTGAVGSTERLKTLTENTADLFGGQAVAQTDTMTGSITQMKNALGDTAESFGAILAPVVSDVAGYFKTAAERAGDFFTRATETSLESSIRELQSLGINTLNLELAFSKAESAKAKYAAIGLKDEAILTKEIEDSATNRVELLTKLGQEQAALLQRGLSEEKLKERIAGAELMISSASSGRMADQKVIGMQLKKEAEEQLKTIEILRLQITEQENVSTLAQTDLITVQKKEAALQNVLALEEAIKQNKSDSPLNPDYKPPEPMVFAPPVPEEAPPVPEETLTAYDEFVLKMQELNAQREIESQWNQQFIEQYPLLAEQLGLVTEAGEGQVAQMSKAEQFTGQFSDAMVQAVVHGQDMGEAVKSALKAILIQYASNVIKQKLLSKLFKAEEVASAAAAGTAVASAWATPAALASTASFGGAAAAGMAGVVTTVAGTQALALMHEGGLIGGQGDTPIMAQSGEFVLSRSAVQSIGLDTAQRINQGQGGGITINISAPLVDETVVAHIIPAIEKAQGLGLA